MSRNQIWHQDSTDIFGNAEEFDFFGFSLTAGDFNGDRTSDLVVGVYGENISDIEDVGAVNVILGSAAGLTTTDNQIWTQNSPGIMGEAGSAERFGGSAIAGDFNGDSISDLAISATGENLGDLSNVGGVNIIYGSGNGLTPIGNQFWTQDSNDIAGNAEDGDKWGKILAAGDFNGDGADDLAIGAEDEDIGDVIDAGAVNIIYGSMVSRGSAGLTATNNHVWHQNSLGIVGTSENGDKWGKSLAVEDFNGDGADDLAVGVADEDIGDVVDAGAVNIIYGSDAGLTAMDNQIWTQDSPEIIGNLENADRWGESLAAGDFNGDGIGDLAVGVADEDIGDVVDAGAVNIIYGSDTGLTATNNQVWHQNSTDIIGNAENLDNFGSSLAVGDFNGDGKDDIAIASLFESIGDVELAGAVNVIYGSDAGLTATDNQIWHQDSLGIAGNFEDFDSFGSSLSAGDFNNDGFADLAIGSPSDSINDISNAGAVNIIYGSESGLSAF